MLKHDYGQREDFEEEHPGNRLRARLSDVERLDDVDDVMAELLYTAAETGIFEDFESISMNDALTIVRLWKIAETLKRADLPSLRM